jgi:hypothetical protein
MNTNNRQEQVATIAATIADVHIPTQPQTLSQHAASLQDYWTAKNFHAGDITHHPNLK